MAVAIHEGRSGYARLPTGQPSRTMRKAPPIEERFVWWLWHTRRFDTAAARALGFDIVFPGWFNTGAGPDFRDAMIADGAGRLASGDVELHVHEREWRDHGHDRDPRYDDVALHVVLHPPHELTVTSSGRAVPTLALEPLLQHPITDLRQTMGDWQPEVVRCPSHGTPPADALIIIENAGRARFEEKVHRMVSNVEAVGADEALYRDVAESLGYSQNREALRRVAEAVPFRLLATLSLFDIENLLLFAAGLSDPSRLLDTYIDGPVLQAGDLRTFRVRPANHPALRLRALARIVDANREGLSAAFGRLEPTSLWKIFITEAEMPLVGRSRADDMALNIALPYVAAYTGVDARPALASMSAPGGNRWITALRARLAASGVSIRPYRAIHHVGLQALSLRFCRFDHCEACPLHQSPAGQGQAA